MNLTDVELTVSPAGGDLAYIEQALRAWVPPEEPAPGDTAAGELMDAVHAYGSVRRLAAVVVGNHLAHDFAAATGRVVDLAIANQHGAHLVRHVPVDALASWLLDGVWP